MEVQRAAVPEVQRRELPNPYEASRPILKAPPEALREAIDQAIRFGTEEERIGALGVYSELVRAKTELLNPTYHRILLGLLAQDDLESPAYVGTIAGVLYLHPSRDTALAYMDVAARARNREMRDEFMLRTADFLSLSLPIGTETIPVEKARILADFEAWFARNKERIRFDKKGEFRLAGGEAAEERKRLTPQDRARIRKDPLCVLRLLNGSIVGDGAGEDVGTLLIRCGEALYGPGGADLITRMAGEGREDAGSSLDLQAAMATVAGKYPMFDAALLAVAYVAAYEKDPAALKLARKTLADLGPAEITRVTKGEPGEVRRKAEELAGEIAKGGGE